MLEGENSTTIEMCNGLKQSIDNPLNVYTNILMFALSQYMSIISIKCVYKYSHVFVLSLPYLYKFPLSYTY